MHSAHRGNVRFDNGERRGENGRITVYFICMIVFMSVLGVTASHAADQPLFGPKTYTRTQGKPVAVIDAFSGCASGNSGVLRLVNGADKATRVSSAIVFLNGARVIGEHDLNRNVPSLERTVALKPGANTLSVTIKSGEGDDDDDDERHDGKERHHDKDFDAKDNKGGHEDERRSSGGNSDKGVKGEHGDDHGKGDDDRHHEGDDDHQHAPVFLAIEILGRGCDAIAPVISTPQPADGALLAVVRPSLSAAFADNSGGSGVDAASVRVTLDGSDLTAACSVTATGVACNLTSDLTDGMHTAMVAVADLAKNPASYSWRFTTDTTPPQVTVTSPQSGQNLGNPLVTVTGTVDNTAATVTVTSTSPSAGTTTATLTGLTFSAADVPLTEGANTLTIVAVDQAGNRSTAPLAVTLDTSLPVVTITAPVDGSFTNVPTATVSGQVSETPSGLTVNGRTATLTGQTFTLENLPLAEGQNTISAEARDLAGNKGSAVSTVNLDTVNPQIFITAPADGLLTRNPQLTVSGTVSEPLTSLFVTSTSLSAGTSIPLDGRTFTTNLTLNEGVNSIVLTATDRAGNKGAVTLTITLDSTPPTVPVLEALTTPTNNPIAVVKGSAESGSSVALSAGGVQFASTTADSNGLFSFAGLTLTEGETLFTAQATDLAGNTGQPSVPLAVTLDTNAPAVDITTPSDKAIINTQVVTVSGSIDDPTAAVTVNGLPALNSGGVWTLEGFTLQEGNNSLLVEARDPAGNKGSATVSVTLDTIPPTVTISNPVDGLYTNVTQLTVTGKMNEEASSVTVNGIAATISTISPSSSTYTTTLTLIEGVNSIVVTAVDKAGNKGSVTVSVTLDTIAPQLTVIGPADGALLSNGQITFGGAAAEPVVSVLVNGIAAQHGTNGYTLPLTLAEGSNTLTVTAIDRAGNRSTSTITVNLDSTAPQAPLLDLLATPTRTAATTVSGQAEPLTQVRLSNNGQQIAQLATDAAGQFTVADVTLTEGSNLFTATATDAAGNSSQPSAPLTVVLDTKPPVITVTAPQPGALVSAPQTTITGTVDEPLASLTVNGGAATLTGTAFEYVIALAAGENSALITAIDLAGNAATTTVTVKRDSTPPKVTIIAPLNGLLTNSPQIQVSGTVDDAEATLSVAGAPVTLANKSFSVSYVLTDGENSIQVKAIDKAGNEGSAAVQVVLDAQPPTLTLGAPATATAGTDVQISLSAADNRGLTLVDLSAEGASLWSAAPGGTTTGQSVSLRLSPTLAPGATVTLRARALDAAGNSGSATTVITIDKGADGPGWLQGKVLDDNRGLPLEGARVSVTDSTGQQQNITIPADGAWFFELASGPARVEAVKDGYTSVRRDVTVRPGQRTSVLDSRLTKIDGTIDTVDATGGAVKSAPFKIQNTSFTIDLSIPAAALAAPADVRLTPLSNQGLIAPLPLGWSPLAAADVRLLDPVTAAVNEPQPLTAAAVITFPLPKGLGDTALTAQLARYDNSSRSWLAITDVTIAANAITATAQINQPGQYALVLADPAPNAPPVALAGQELKPSAISLQPDFSLITTTGRVVPQAAIPSVGLRAAGDLLLVARADAAPALISGLVVTARVTEKFDLTGGDKLQPAATLQDLVLYRTPCATSIAGGSTEPFDPAAGLRTTFPVSPSRDFTIVDLLLGKISIEISPPDTSGGVMVGADGARLLQPDGTALSIPAGALSGTAPVTVVTLPASSVSALVGADFRLLRGVDIGIGGQSLKSGATLSIPAPSGFDPTLPVVVAKKFDVKGGSRLKLVAAGTVTGSIISSAAAITAGNETLPTQGISTSGQYLFLQATAPIGYVTGQVTDAAAAPFAAIQVSARNATLTDQTAANGSYLLALAAAAQTVTALDPTRGDAASGSVTIAANSRSTLNLTVRMVPPTVTAITPANGAINVQTDVAVTVTFSKPMDKSTVTNDTFILRDASSVIPGVITWNAEATVATFYPAEAFKQETAYSIAIAAIVKDLQGYSLGQNVASTFTVRRTTPPVMPAAGAVSGTFPDADGYITVTATQGSAAADNTVLLINDTTGEIQSVTPLSNGSFTGKVRGQLGDQIKVVLMDHSGNQTTVSYLTFKGPDGSYLVTAKGGKIEGEGGSLLDVPEGALVGPTVLKVTALPEANLPTSLPGKGKYLAGFNIDTGGIGFQKEVHLSIPVPEGFDPKTPVFVTKPSEVYNADGTVEKVYEVIDSTKIVNGRLTTASPPFDGIMEFGSFVFASFPNMDVGIVSGYAYQDMDDSNTFDARLDKPIQGAVIRNSTSWNYVSYSKANGSYASFTDLIGAGNICKDYSVSAMHPLTMLKKNLSGTLCASLYNIEKLNFKLADKTSIPPDKTPPVVSMDIQIFPGQSADVQFVSGTLPVNAKVQIPVTVLDQSQVSSTLSITYRDLDANNFTPESYPSLKQTSLTVEKEIAATNIKIYRYELMPSFRNEDALNYFQVSKAGLYLFKVEVADSAGNVGTRYIQVRVVEQGELPTGKEGAPVVDEILPNSGASTIMINTPITVSFSEPVDYKTVTDETFKLIDTSTGFAIPATITTNIENGRMKALLTPNGNLAFDRTYEVVLTQTIKDANKNNTAGDIYLALDKEYRSRFTTKKPQLYDLTRGQFTGGRDIELFNNPETCSTYAYVAAGDNGYRVTNVTDPKSPSVVFPEDPSTFPKGFNYRCVGIGSDGTLGMTDNIVFGDGNQYGYVRFYDLLKDAVNMKDVKNGQEKLAEAMSGIPGRVAVSGNYAYIATAGAGLQVVDINAAKEHAKTGQMSDGSSIVGGYGLDFGSPNDIIVYKPGKAFLTTNPGYLVSLDLTEPAFPILMNASQPNGQTVQRIAVATDYSYNSSGGATGSMDLVVAGSREGKINTINVTDPYTPSFIKSVTDQNGADLIRIIRDIAINKNSGLAFAITFDAVLVIDIKDPYNPKLLNEIKLIPGTTTPIGSNMALTQRDGWVYLASENSGMRIMDFYTPPQNAKEAVIFVDSVNSLFLDKDGKTLNDLKVKFTINPPGYQAQSATVILVENNNGIKIQSGATTGTGTAVFPKGMLLKKDAKYEVYVVINCNSSDAKVSERKVVNVADVPKIEIRDKNNPCNKAPGKKAKTLILAVDKDNKAYVQFHNASDISSPIGKEFVWSIARSLLGTLPQKGTLTEIEPVMELSTAPIVIDGSLYKDYTLKIAIDSNDNGGFDSTDSMVAEFTVKLIENAYALDRTALNSGALAANITGAELTLNP